MIVLDASAAVDVFLNLGEAARIRERIRSEDSGDSGGIHVPHIFELEVLSTLRRLVFSSDISESEASRAINALSEMKLARYPHTPFIERIWELRENITAYDAAYIALSETLDAPLVTTDGRLARAPGHHARIEFFE